MTIFCDFAETGQSGKFWHLHCKRCGTERRSLRPRLTRICDDQGTLFSPSEQARRRDICESCDQFADDGCRKFKPACSRMARWESAVRVGSCPGGRWEPVLTPPENLLGFP